MRRLALLVLGFGLVIAAWFFSRPTADLQPVDPELEDDRAAIAAASAELPSPLSDASISKRGSADPVPVAAAALAGPPFDARNDTVTLSGFVLPAPGTESDPSSTWVSLTDRLGKSRRSKVNSEGDYSFLHVEPGRFWIRAESDLGGMARRVIDLDLAAGDRRLDLQLGSSLDITIEVVDLVGRPIRSSHLFAVATSEEPGDWLADDTHAKQSWQSNDFGATSSPAPVLGRVRLAIRPPIFVSLVNYQRVIASQRVEPGQTKVRFVLDPTAPELQNGRLRLRLIDGQTRQPLAGIFVSMTYGVGSCTCPPTSVDGIFTMPCVPGVLDLRVPSMEYESAELQVRIEPGVETDLGDITLGPAISISGMVLDDQGQGRETLITYDMLDPITRAPGYQGIQWAVKSSADGSFQVTAIAHRIYRLRVRDEAFALQSMDVDARSGSVENVIMRVARGEPLIVSSDDRWPLVRFDVLDESGVLVISNRPLYGPEPEKILLTPGLYEVEVRVAGVLEGARRLLTIASEPVELVLP